MKDGAPTAACVRQASISLYVLGAYHLLAGAAMLAQLASLPKGWHFWSGGIGVSVLWGGFLIWCGRNLLLRNVLSELVVVFALLSLPAVVAGAFFVPRLDSTIYTVSVCVGGALQILAFILVLRARSWHRRQAQLEQKPA